MTDSETLELAQLREAVRNLQAQLDAMARKLQTTADICRSCPVFGCTDEGTEQGVNHGLA
ncbi:MAG: hypothetical protein JJD98_00245 [Polaromonas sp.]|nr:hypothetical protein [Polaromonas sp.]